MAGLTRDSHIIVAGPTWAEVLDDDFNEATLGATTTIGTAPSKGRSWVQKFATQLDQSIAIGTLYQGAGTNAMRAAREGAAFLMLDGGGGSPAAWAGGESVWPSISESAQSNDPIVDNVTIMPAEKGRKWARGFCAVRFELTASKTEQALPAFANTDDAYIVVTAKSQASQGVRLTDGSRNVDTTFTANGFKRVAIANMAASVSAGKVSAQLSSNQTVAGYVFIGAPWATP